MSGTNSKTRTVTPRPRKRLSPGGVEPALAGDFFKATLSGCAQTETAGGSAIVSLSAPRQLNWMRVQAIGSSVLARAWSFLHAKYKISTTKRLRVSETISLGEKRFVAIVTVEGKEFLIGGGVAGMSLLAQLGSGAKPTRRVKQTIGAGEVVL